MEGFLNALLQDLERRCGVLRDRLAAVQSNPDVRDHALEAYRVVEGVRRDVADLLGDASLRESALLRNHLHLYKRWNELATLVESYPLPFVERYDEPDRRLTVLCRRLTEQAAWPLPPPLVGAFSSQYYWTSAPFNLICAPAAETDTLLGLPDLCHELGHVLLIRHEAAMAGDFFQELAAYVESERRRVQTQQRPPEYGSLYDALFAQWRDAWVREFLSDMVAIYLIGPAFGWQHVRLCAGGARAAYHPTLSEIADHPADEARLRGVAAVLVQMEASKSAEDIRALWERYLQTSGEGRPADYEVCYPQHLVESLARRAVDGCRALGLRRFDEGRSTASTDLRFLIHEAWGRFLADPQAFIAWEQTQLTQVWRELGFA